MIEPKRYMIIDRTKMQLTGEPVYVVLQYPAPDGEFVKVSELKQLLEEPALTQPPNWERMKAFDRAVFRSGYYWRNRELLAELDTSKKSADGKRTVK